MKTNHKPDTPSRLGQWLLDYVDTQNTTLTSLAIQAGLSASSLRYLVKESHRLPSLETCLRLAVITGKSAAEIFEMAGVYAPEGAAQLNPIRLELVKIYDRLSPSLRSLLLDVGRRLLSVNRKGEMHSQK